MTQINRLSECARFLRNSSPVEFEEFIKEFRAYTDTITVAVTQATPNDILVCQGRAQLAIAVLRMLIECDKRPEPKQPAPQ